MDVEAFVHHALPPKLDEVPLGLSELGLGFHQGPWLGTDNPLGCLRGGQEDGLREEGPKRS